LQAFDEQYGRALVARKDKKSKKAEKKLLKKVAKKLNKEAKKKKRGLNVEMEDEDSENTGPENTEDGDDSLV
jgi:hypothetical protein